MPRPSSQARAEARQHGNPTYEGAPCAAAGHRQRYTRNGICVACHAAAVKRSRSKESSNG